MYVFTYLRYADDYSIFFISSKSVYELDKTMHADIEKSPLLNIINLK